MNKTGDIRCSIVIRCFNEEQHIGRLLSGITQQTVRDVEIIVVDSGSTDATLDIASRYPVKVVSIRPQDFSFGSSLNAGCREATGEFIVIASAHVYPVYRDWLEKLLAPFADASVALVYGKQRGPSSARFSEQRVFRKWFPDTSDPCQKHPFCNNANAAIRRGLWQEIPYNVELTGLEDLDWAKRAMERGYYIAYAADAEIIHVHNETFRQIYNRYLREGMAHKRIFPEQKFSFWDFIRLFIGNTVTGYLQLWHDKSWRRHKLVTLLSIPLYRLVQFWGTYRGFARPVTVTVKLKERFFYPHGVIAADEVPAERQHQRIDYSVNKAEGDKPRVHDN
jgi:rhamnosyltransferase